MKTFEQVLLLKPELSFNMALFVSTMIDSASLKVTVENINAILEAMEEVLKEAV